MPVANVFSKWTSGDLEFYSADQSSIVKICAATGDFELGVGQYVKGQRFVLNLYPIAAANLAQIFFEAPAACKVIGLKENRGTAANTTAQLQIEKLTSVQDPGAGVVCLVTNITGNRTAGNAAIGTGNTSGDASLVAGDRLAFKTSETATNYAGGIWTVTMEWL